MKSVKSIVASIGAAVLLLLVAGGAEAGGYGRHGGHYGGYGGHYGGYYRGGGHGSNFGFSFVAPLYAGPAYYGPSPYYYPRSTIIVQPEPQVYIQRAPAVVTAPPAAPTVWFYCPAPAGYYPYVQNCTQAWVSVDPNTVAPRPNR